MQKKITAKVLENNKLTDDIYQLVCEIQDENDFVFVAGQYVLFSKIYKGSEIRRAYSISSIPSDLPKVEFTIRRYEDGVMSSYLTSLKKDDLVQFGVALGHFNIDKLKGKSVVMIAIGCGIAPLKSMINYWLENQVDVNIDLFFGNRHVENIVYHDHFEEIAEKYNNFKYYPCISQLKDSGCQYVGRVGDVIKKIDYDLSDREFFISGTMQMVDQMKEMIVEGGGEIANIYFENIYPKSNK